MIRRTEIGEPPGCRAAMQARRHWLRSVAAGVAVLALGPGRGLAAEPALPALEVFRSPSCGCCGAWIAHMEAAGFAVQARMVADTAAARRRLGMPARLGSCHTGLVAGYVIEGHVPAADVRRLLSTRPDAIGLAVPGMPVGSPGMEMGEQRDPYQVLLVGRDGSESVFSSYPGARQGA